MTGKRSCSGIRLPSDFGKIRQSFFVLRALVGLEWGATLRQGDFWATIAAGPNYTRATVDSYYTPPGGPRTLQYSYELSGLGGTAQAIFGYKLSDLAGFELTGFVSNHTQTYGGILLSFIVGDLE